MTNRILMSVLAGAVLVAAPAVRAGGLPVFKCGAGKQKAVSKDESGQINCYAKNVLKPDVAPGQPVLTACVGKAQTGLSGAFGKLLLKPPPCPGDAPTVGAEVDSCRNLIVNAISSDGQGTVPVGQEKCVAAKLKAAAKGAAGEVGCHSKETGKGGLCSVTVTTPCDIDSACPAGETCVAVPPARVCSVSLIKCTSDTACGGSGGSCVDACLKKVKDKTAAALAKADLAAPCVGSAAGIQATIDGNCVTTITNGLPGKQLGCGNGVIEPPSPPDVPVQETCDDGNLLDGDGCPSSCVVSSCQPVTGTASAHVSYTPPAGVTVAGLQIFVDYPEGKVHGASVAHTFGVQGSATDLGYGLNDALVKNPPAALPATLMQINFANLCQGASAAVAGDYSCTVTDASDDQSNPIDLTAHPISCSVTVP